MKLIPIYCAAGSNSNPGNDSQPFHRTHPPHPREGNFPEVLTWDWKSWLPLAMFPHYTCSFHLLWTKRMFDLYRYFYIKFLRETGKDTLWRAWKEVILFWILFGVFFFLRRWKMKNSLQIQWRLQDDYTGHLQNLYIQIWKKIDCPWRHMFLNVDCSRVL